MRRIILPLFLFVLLILPAQAQDGYRLRVPSAEEYIERITDIAAAQPFRGEWDTPLYLNITDELFRRFPDLNTVDFAKILAAYDAMGIGMDGMFWKRGQWVEAMIAAWLAQNQPDLSGESVLSFADFRIRVTPRDFNNDGQNEYVLDVNKGQPTDRLDCGYQAEYVNYLVVQPTGGGYRFIPTPLYWEGHGTYSAVTNFGEGGQIELGFRDINADGLPEWLVVVGGETFGGPQAGYENVGQLFILAWRDGHLVDLGAVGDGSQYPFSATYYTEDSSGCDLAVPHDVTWIYANLDDDAALEILQRQVYLDNWLCVARETRVLDWNTGQDHYVETRTFRDFPEYTRNCAQRQAEEAMWEHDYPAAIRLYEKALTLPQYLLYTRGDPYSNDVEQYESTQADLNQYLLARLGLVYALTGQPDRADEVIHRLIQGTPFTSEPLRHFAEALQNTTDDPFRACLAAYDVFTRQYPERRYGQTIERFSGNSGYYPEYDPSRVGCDAPAMLLQTLRADPIPLTESPGDRLAEIGLPANNVIQADLNGDGQDEWLIWPESLIPPLFFAADGDFYTVSQPMLDPYQHSESVQTWRLPGNTGIGFIYFESERAASFPAPWSCVYDPVCGVGSYIECVEERSKRLSLWRMEGSTLVQAFRDYVCAADLETVFPDGEASTLLNGGTSVQMFWGNDGILHTVSQPLVFTWDDATRTYWRPPATPQPTPTAQPEPFYRSSAEALWAGDYPAALTLLNEYIVKSQDYFREHPDDLYTQQFTRAFILEALNRPDEALAEYVTIYETAPESAWGMLAALHIEKVEGGE